MATLNQANLYHAVRDNTAWGNLDPSKAEALLQDAGDYIRSRYSVRAVLTTDEQRLLDQAVYRLAGIFQTNPPAGAAMPSIKSEKKELAGMKKEVEYNPADPDPYPYITAIVRSLLRADTSHTVLMGKVTG